MIARLGARPTRLLAAFVAFAGAAAADRPAPAADDGPAPVYAADPSDSWNRIFHALFSRTVRHRTAAELLPGTPAESIQVPGFPAFRASTQAFERFEVADRAIEPLAAFPVHMGSRGTPQAVLSGRRFDELARALGDAIREGPSRPPLARALMQSDLWAAHDVLFASRPRDATARAGRHELLGLLARGIKMVALTRREIAALPGDVADAGLPAGLLGADGGWIEVLPASERLHDISSDDRRVARVFLKPSAPAPDRERWLAETLAGDAPMTDRLDAAALLIRLLLVADDGGVVPSRLAYEAQVRTFPRGGDGRPKRAEVAVAELSRRAALLGRRPGGLVRADERDPAYLPAAGNDYFFASDRADGSGRTEPILATLRARCRACHGEDLGVVFSLPRHVPDGGRARPTDPAADEHADAVARRKLERPDFVALRRAWGG